MQLYTLSGDTYEPANEETVLTVARAIAARDIVRTHAMTTPRAVREFLAIQFAGLEHEVFAVIFADTRHRVIAFETMFRGTIDGASVHPREVVKAALKYNARAVIFAHNHPSGVAEPSPADELITRRLTDALALVDVGVLDHVIVAGPRSMSFAERGMI
jgi:DNA repair protein RadC